jgi:hypothetical protein
MFCHLRERNDTSVAAVTPEMVQLSRQFAKYRLDVFASLRTMRPFSWLWLDRIVTIVRLVVVTHYCEEVAKFYS